MICPKCRDAALRSIKSATEGLDLLHCPSCKGMWLTPEQVSIISEIALEEETPGAPASEDKRGGMCPEGHGLLTRAKVDIDPPFYLERCSKCGGVWFDKGEYGRLMENHLLEHVAEFWTSSWQSKQRAEKSRDAYLKIMEERLGTELSQNLIALAESLKDHPERIQAVAFLKHEILSPPPKD